MREVSKQYNKFLDYVENYLSDDVLKRVKIFCSRDFSNILLNLNDRYYSNLYRTEYKGINDLNIVTVKVWDYDGLPDGICFDTVCNPEVIFFI